MMKSSTLAMFLALAIGFGLLYTYEVSGAAEVVLAHAGPPPPPVVVAAQEVLRAEITPLFCPDIVADPVAIHHALEKNNLKQSDLLKSDLLWDYVLLTFKVFRLRYDEDPALVCSLSIVTDPEYVPLMRKKFQ